MRRKFPSSILFAAMLIVGGVAHAKHVYQYTDANGVVHFTDVKPGDEVKDVKSTLVRAETQALLRSREEGTDADRTLVLVNDSGGAVTVEFKFDQSDNVRSEPPLPARVVVPARSEMRALRIVPVNAAAGYGYQLRYSMMPGDFRAQPDANARYQLPFASGHTFRISQAFGGAASHHDTQNYYAVDIGMPEGTPVLAARDGMVMTVDNDFYGSGLDMKKYGDRANNIRIMHADGTMAVYAHLKLESARVSVGDRVRAGQELALSGDTGYTSGPHLHFVVQRNQDMELVAIPFQFSGANGSFEPVMGMDVGG